MSKTTKKKAPAYRPLMDVEFSAHLVPKYCAGSGAISLTGYKGSVYLEIARNGRCCPASTERIEIPLSEGRDFDKLIDILKRAKKAAQKARGK